MLRKDDSRDVVVRLRHDSDRGHRPIANRPQVANLPHILLFGLLAPLVFAQSAAQGIRTGPQLTTFHSDVDNSNQPYALYVPKSFTPDKKYPLVISLHQEDSNHRLN
jgi:poly(3-hydroxybutyrate) depolymerase